MDDEMIKDNAAKNEDGDWADSVTLLEDAQGMAAEQDHTGFWTFIIVVVLIVAALIAIAVKIVAWLARTLVGISDLIDAKTKEINRRH